MDSIEVNLDFGIYRIANLKFIPYTSQYAVLYHMNTHEFRLVERWLAQALACCVKFNTAAQHIRAVRETLKLNDEQTRRLAKEWPGLVQGGYILSLHEILMAATGKSDMDQKAEPICSLGVPTRNRPDCIERFLSDLTGQKEVSTVVISDDSDDVNAVKVSRLVQKYSSDHLPVVYFGREEKESFIERLSHNSGVPVSVLKFAVSGIDAAGFSGGANRNALMLFLAGRKYLSLDDDVLCRIAEYPEKRETLRMSSIHDPTEFFFFGSSTLYEPPLHFYAGLESLNKIHEPFLGYSMQPLIARHSGKGSVDLNDASPAFLDGLVRQNGKIVVTMMGILGDSGMASNHYYLFLNGISRERFLSSQDFYENYKKSRNVMRSVSAPSVTDGAFLMTTALGFDGRDILPPFFPVFRNEDAVFGMTLKTLFPHKFIAYLPDAIEHRPMIERTFDSQAIWRVPSRASSSWILTESFRSCALGREESSERRLSLMSDHFIRLGNLNVTEFSDFLMPRFVAMQADHVQRLEKILDIYHGKPDYWADDVRKSISYARTELKRKNILFPMDLDGKFSLESQALSFIQDLIKKYGTLLLEWPKIYSAAKNLSKENAAASLR